MNESTPTAAPVPTANLGAGASPPKLTPGQQLYLAEHDLLPFKNPRARYLILSAQRTGSNYLCRRLCNIQGRFGLPSEYLNNSAIELMSPRLIPGFNPGSPIPLNKYFRAVERARTTADGWFGVKVQPEQLMAAVKNKQAAARQFVESFDRLVLLTRRDKLGQAISGAIAHVSGQWFNDGTEPNIPAARMNELMALVARYLTRYIDEEYWLLDLGRKISLPLLRIEYEQIDENGQAAFMELVEFLSAGNSEPLVERGTAPVPEKPPGRFADELRERFLAFIGGGTLA